MEKITILSFGKSIPFFDSIDLTITIPAVYSIVIFPIFNIVTLSAFCSYNIVISPIFNIVTLSTFCS